MFWRAVSEGLVIGYESTAQLIDAIKGQHLWAESYDRDFKNIFEIQDEITLRIVTALRVKLTEGDQARILGKEN